MIFVVDRLKVSLYTLTTQLFSSVHARKSWKWRAFKVPSLPISLGVAYCPFVSSRPGRVGRPLTESPRRHRYMRRGHSRWIQWGSSTRICCSFPRCPGSFKAKSVCRGRQNQGVHHKCDLPIICSSWPWADFPCRSTLLITRSITRGLRVEWSLWIGYPKTRVENYFGDSYAKRPVSWYKLGMLQRRSYRG